MTKEIIIKEFITFLKQNNAYQKYKINLSRSLYGKCNFIGYTCGFQYKILNPYKDNAFNKNAVTNYINNAFNWDGTKEKHAFWWTLDKKWYNIVIKKKLYIERKNYIQDI